MVGITRSKVIVPNGFPAYSPRVPTSTLFGGRFKQAPKKPLPFRGCQTPPVAATKTPVGDESRRSRVPFARPVLHGFAILFPALHRVQGLDADPHSQRGEDSEFQSTWSKDM